MRSLFIAFLLCTIGVHAQQILPLRERAQVIEELHRDRMENLLPDLMRKSELDMWILITREYNEDPVLKTMLPPTWLNARRRTILVFSKDTTGAVKRVAMTRYGFGELFPGAWNPEKQPDQFAALAEYVVAHNPKRIGINMSENYGITDGLSHTDYTGLYNALPSKYRKRLQSADGLSVAWIESRTDREIEIFEELAEITHDVIAEAFSTKVITPGQTTTEDVVWWMREKIESLGLSTWFHPTVDIQRSEGTGLYGFDGKPDEQLIQPGDLIHCDMGITYLTMNTDCQELAYVLKEGETAAPDFLQRALEEGNRVQDVFTGNFKTGRTGNETLAMTLREAREKAYKPQIYTHPLGTYGHSAGTTFGMWDKQEGVPGTGDHPLRDGTTYAIELNTKVFVKEWNREIRIMLEEAGYWKDGQLRYLDGRQKKLLLVGGNAQHLGQ